MLVLSLSVHERVFLTLPDGSQILLTFAERRRGNVRLGIEAPHGIRIRREQLRDREKASGEAVSPDSRGSPLPKGASPVF